MAKEYRLQALLGIRERAKQDAEQFLGACMAALKVEQDRLREMEAELERMIAKRESRRREYAEKTMRGEMDARGAASANLYIERLKEQEEMQKSAIEGQKGVIEKKKNEVEAAREDWVTANQELKAIEKHKEKWQQKRDREIAIQQEELQDEVAQTIYMGRDRD